MGVTTNYQFPYPEPSDENDPPLHMQQALTAIDTKFATVDAQIAASSYTAPTLSTASLYANAPQSIPEDTWTDIRFQVEQLDNLGGHSTSSLTQIYKIPQAGYYMVTATGGFENATMNGMRAAAIRLLPATTQVYRYIAYQSGQPTSNIEWLASLSFFGPLAAGDFITFALWHNGTNASINSAGANNYPARLGVRQLL